MDWCGWSRLPPAAVSFTAMWDLCWRGRGEEEEDESVIISGFRVHGYLRLDQGSRGCRRGAPGCGVALVVPMWS